MSLKEKKLLPIEEINKRRSNIEEGLCFAKLDGNTEGFIDSEVQPIIDRYIYGEIDESTMCDLIERHYLGTNYNTLN